MAIEDTRLCACYKSDLENLLFEDPKLSVKVIKVLGDKINRTTEKLADMAFYDTRTKLVRTLVRLIEARGEEIDNKRRLTFRLTHEDLGCLVRASRVTVTNTMKSLKNVASPRMILITNW